MDPVEGLDFNTTVRWVRAAQAGNRQAVEDLFARYAPRVRQIVSLRMGTRLRQYMELEDVTQQVLLKAFQGLDRFEHKSEGSFCNWLAECVACEVASLARKMDTEKRGEGREREPLLSSVFADRGPTPSQVAQANETEERMEEALLAMPKKYREVIILRHLCDMSYKEIAAQMGFSQEVNARKAFSRAIKKLEETLY